MDQNISSASKEYLKENFNPSFIEDNEEFDDINFTAITDGLGFHHGQESKNTTRRAKNKTVSQKIVNALPKKSVLPIEQAYPSNKTATYMGGLEAFYSGSEKVEKKNIEIKNMSLSKKPIFASVIERSLAFVVDIFIIFTFLVITIGILILSSGVSFEVFNQLLTLNEKIIYPGLLFVLNYLLYFTMLDIKASPGKILFGFSLETKKGKNISAINALLRALLSLTIVPMLFGFNDYIFSSRAVKVDEIK